MDILKERIRADSVIKSEDVLKVDNFLNHQIDVSLLDDMGKEFHRLFGETTISKVLTIESSGIGIACMTAWHFGVPAVFAKKRLSINLDGDMYVAPVQSYTRGQFTDVVVAKKFLGTNDHVLIVDDILGNGSAMDGLVDICQSAGATIEGVGIVIEKAFEPGGKALRDRGLRVESLAIIENMDPNTGEITFG